MIFTMIDVNKSENLQKKIKEIRQRSFLQEDQRENDANIDIFSIGRFYSSVGLCEIKSNIKIDSFDKTPMKIDR